MKQTFCVLAERLLWNQRTFEFALGLPLEGGVAGVLARYVVCGELFSQIFLSMH